MLESRLRALNPAAPIVHAANGAIEPSAILNTGIYDAKGAVADIEQWLNTNCYRPVSPDAALSFGYSQRHDRRIRSFAIVYEQPVSGSQLWQGLEALIEQSGEKLLRVKGIVNVAGQSQPRAMHIVQHVLYPVTVLPEWPDEDRRTRLVFIVRDLEPDEVRDTLRRALTEVR